MKLKPGLTVVIVTARDTQHVDYSVLLQHRESPEATLRYLACVHAGMAPEFQTHVEAQLQAIACGTAWPDRVLIVGRPPYLPQNYAVWDGWPFPVEAVWPKIGPAELTREPAAGSLQGRAQDRDAVYGCSDKNTAIALCETEQLLLLDDACLLTPATVARVKLCLEPQHPFWLLGHRKLFADPAADPPWSSANWEGEVDRFVCGIFAALTEFCCALGGYDEAFDGQSSSYDIEFYNRAAAAAPNPLGAVLGAVYEVPHSDHAPITCTKRPEPGLASALRLRRESCNLQLAMEARRRAAAQEEADDDDEFVIESDE